MQRGLAFRQERAGQKLNTISERLKTYGGIPKLRRLLDKAVLLAYKTAK